VAEELVGLTRSYDVDVVGMFLVVLIPMYAVLYSALEASVNSIMYYILYISTLVVVIIVTRTTTKAGTDCNESPTTPLGYGTLTGHCLGRTDQGRGSSTTFQSNNLRTASQPTYMLTSN